MRNGANMDFVVNSRTQLTTCSHIAKKQLMCMNMYRPHRDMNHLISKLGRNLKVAEFGDIKCSLEQKYQLQYIFKTSISEYGPSSW